MKIQLASVFVDDQAKALSFYTEILGFVKKVEMPAGKFKWLTVGSRENTDDVQLLLEPNDNPAARAFQKAIFEQGIPATSFACTDVKREYEKLESRGVVFRKQPTPAGPTTIAVFDDTCGNLIQIHQV